MEILLSAGYIDTNQNANLNIVLSLAKALNSQGHSCTLVGFSSDTTGKIDIIDYCGIKRNNWIDYFTAKTDAMNLDYEGLISNRVKLLSFALRHPFCMLFLILRRLGFVEKAEQKTYKNGVKNLASELKSDAIIAFCAPFHLACAAIDENFKGKQIYYQLDPYGKHSLLDKMHIYDRIEQEISLINKVDAVITTKLLLDAYTKLLYDSYLLDETYAKQAEKMQWVDFPVLQKTQSKNATCVFDFNEQNINMLFCGSVDDAYRNPKFLLDMLKPILQRNNHIKVYFLGGCNSKVLLDVARELPNQITVHGVVPLAQAQKTMEQADILINIGNNIQNMMPSKIFDYFAKGKPILNIEILEHCPANCYFERYPLHLTLNQVTDFDILNNTKLENFILQSKAKSLDFEQVAQIYKEATPTFVANKITGILKK